MRFRRQVCSIESELFHGRCRCDSIEQDHPIKEFSMWLTGIQGGLTFGGKNEVRLQCD